MTKSRQKKTTARTQAMWLIAHLRSMGVEPAPIEHLTYRTYRANLQRQHDSTRASMDEVAASLARTAARSAVKTMTLEGVAGDLVPAPVMLVAHVTKADRGVGHDSNCDLRFAPRSETATEQSQVAIRDIQICRRKLRHLNYLSALNHLVRLGDVGMHAYHCSVCLGLHVGHDRSRARLQAVGKRLDEVNLNIAALHSEKAQLEEKHRSLFNAQIHQTKDELGDFDPESDRP